MLTMYKPSSMHLLGWQHVHPEATAFMAVAVLPVI